MSFSDVMLTIGVAVFVSLILYLAYTCIIRAFFNEKAPVRIVRLSKVIYILILFLLVALGVCLFIVCLFDNNSMLAAILSTAAIITIIIYLSLFALWKIKYDDEKFTYRTYTNKIVTIKYNEIIKSEYKKSAYWVFTESHTISFDLYSGLTGLPGFIQTLLKHAPKQIE